MRRISDFLFLLHLKQLLAILPAIGRDNYEERFSLLLSHWLFWCFYELGKLLFVA